ncbi:MAG: sigma-70 family RNA polymerase sigma factor [Acidobacteriaceae bacterium]
MIQSDWLAERFESHRNHLRAVAYRMLGSLCEADDAVQEAWLRLIRSDVSSVDNLGGWLTTVVARVCLDILRSRKSRREESLEPGITPIKADVSSWLGPEEEVMMADSVGLALLVVLDTLSPAERLAFVLHDIFGMSFHDIAPIVERSPVAAKKLASRARQRVQGRETAGNADLGRQRGVVEAFLTASRSGDISALIAVLDPDVLRRADRSALAPDAAIEVRGAHKVAAETATNAGLAQHARIALVNEAIGLIVVLRCQLQVALSLKIEGEKIMEIDVIADPVRLRLTKVAPLREA